MRAPVPSPAKTKADIAKLRRARERLEAIKHQIEPGTFSFADGKQRRLLERERGIIRRYAPRPFGAALRMLGKPVTRATRHTAVILAEREGFEPSKGF